MAAATLSSAAAVPIGRQEATLTVSSDQATGTCYVVVTSSSTTPTHAQIVAGQDHNGATTLVMYSSSAAAAANNSFSATNIKRSHARLYAHYSQTNGGAENSTPVTSNLFWLHEVGFGTLNANGTTSEVTLAYPLIRVSGTFGSGTITWSYKDSSGTWVAIDGAAFTAADQQVVQFHRPATIRGVLTGSTSPSLAWEVR